MKYIETIKVVNGQIQNLELHRERMLRTIGQVLPIETDVALLEGVSKYRLVYDSQQILESTLTPYSISSISSLKLVDGGKIEYSSKFLDRSCIDELMKRKGECDDIIVVKNGMITDSSYCNLVFENEAGLFTPADSLLKGTKREFLLRNGIIQERNIQVGDLAQFNRIRLINAMIDLEDNLIVNVSAVDKAGWRI